MVWAAWHIAGWSRAKRLPNLKRLLREMAPPSKPPRKSPKQLLQIAKQITASMRGKKD